MGSSLLHIDPSIVITADTSAVINLNATGFSREILSAIPNEITIADVVPAELEEGRAKGRRSADLTSEHVASGLIRIVPLSESANRCFEQLVIGPADQTLEDGEAATIALACTTNTIAVIDERKATRICSEQFPEVEVASTLDLLAHPEVRRSLGEHLSDAVFRALIDGRMRVPPPHLEWVIELIGYERATRCTSLPLHARVRVI